MCPMISIIIPIYKVEKYLRDCVDSVLNQSYQDYEIILVNDGSPDMCPQICDEYVDKDKRIKVLHKKNEGLAAARNSGMDIATGKYIQFLDSDDTLEPDAFKKCINAAERYKADVVVFGTRQHVIEEDGLCINIKEKVPMETFYEGNQRIGLKLWKLIKNETWVYIWDKLIRREVIVKNGIRSDTAFITTQDTPFIMDLLPHVERLYVLPSCEHNYLIRQNQSVVTKFVPYRYKYYYMRFLRIKKLVGDYYPCAENIELLYEQYCTSILWGYENALKSQKMLSRLEQFKHVNDIFRIIQEPRAFRKEAYAFYRKSGLLGSENNCGETRLALWFVIRKLYMMVGMLYTTKRLFEKNGTLCNIRIMKGKK